MIWRESLPARIALSTAAMLALVLLLTVASSYALTALLLQRGVDSALQAAVPLSAQGLHDLTEEPERWESRDPEHRRLQVLDATGRVLLRPAILPVDQRAVAAAMQRGVAFTSVLERDGRLVPRSEGALWQALTPQRNELRVMYARIQTEEGLAVLQAAAPVGEAAEILPDLLKWLSVLAVLASLAAGALAWRMAAESYRPLQAITATAASISKDTLSRRIESRWSDRTLRRLIGVLNAMVARLQEAFETQGRFSAAAAHELRSPLAAMRAELEVALRRDRSVEEYRQALEGALEETARLADLAEHLLILARYERGAAPAMERDVPLHPLLDRAAQEARSAVPGAVSTSAVVEVAAPDELTVDVDAVALERALVNLVRNGLQAGGAPVAITAVDLGDEVRLEVRDSGRGIPADALPRLFEPFFRADPARRRDGGAGLGLAIVKAVADAHHGQMEVDSRPGEGATFRIVLPKRQQ
ncbi:MAG: sensor histidine kinase [Bacillota bacterium]